jgi:hypothetical protein
MPLQTTARRGWSIKWGGATQAQQGMTLRDNYNFYFFIFYHENQTLLTMWESIRFSDWMSGENLGGSHLQWEPSVQFSWRFSLPGHSTRRFSTVQHWKLPSILFRQSKKKRWILCKRLRYGMSCCKCQSSTV